MSIPRYQLVVYRENTVPTKTNTQLLHIKKRKGKKASIVQK